MANTSAPIKGAMIEEPPAAGNRRHPSDLLRLIIALLATILGFVLATMLNEISEAITVEVIEVFDAVPSAVMVVLLLLLSIIGFILPFVVIWFFVKHKRWRSLGLAAVAVAGSLLLLWVVDTYLVSKFSAPDLPFTRPRWICAPGADPATLGPLECANVPSLSNPIERYGYLVAFTAFFSAVIPHLTRRWKRFGWITIVTFAVTRMLSFLDAPVDEFLAIGIAYSMGVGVLLVFGDTDRRPRGADIAAGLQRAGITLSALKRANVDARGSVPYFATQQNGRGLFVKVLTLDERAADIMFRVLRMFRLKGVGDERPFSSLKRAVEHEAVVSLMASKDGVETPQLQAVADIPPSSMVMAYDAIDGRSLDSVPAEMMTDQLLHHYRF